jgi:hypothetical protein
VELTQAKIIDLKRYLELCDKACSKHGIKMDEAIERKVLAKEFESINLLKTLLDEVERLKGGNK